MQYLYFNSRAVHQPLSRILSVLPFLRRWAGTLEVKSEAESLTSWSSSCSNVNRLFHSDTVLGKPRSRTQSPDTVTLKGFQEKLL